MMALTSTDALPEGPYTVGLTKGPGSYAGPPWTVRCGDGRAICGSVHSRETAEKIARAMNTVAGAASVDWRAALRNHT